MLHSDYLEAGKRCHDYLVARGTTPDYLVAEKWCRYDVNRSSIGFQFDDFAGSRSVHS